METIRTRLYRARKRLREEEELLIQEVLGGVQISLSIKQNVMRKIVDLKPTPSVKVESAAQLRLQFLVQPDWTTGERLGEFFVGSKPFVLTREGFPKIFSVVRDDSFPHLETGIGLWLISNGTVEAGDEEHPDRLFNASDPKGLDHGGRFAFVIPK